VTVRCRRCDFTAPDDESATEHAATTGHLRCVVCQRQSLTDLERQTCPGCIGRVRADLADIAQGYALLEPAGLTALTLLGDGTMQRLFRADEWASYGVTAHPLARDGEQTVTPIRDEWPSDPLPVVAALVSWEDFIREHYRLPRGPDGPTLTLVVGWLSARLDSRLNLAQTFGAFDEFAADVSRLRTLVQHSAGLADVPLEADAKCFDCGGPLLRTYRPSSNSGHRRPGLPWEGLTDDWTCAWCRWVYGQQGYFLGLRDAASVWVSVAVAAKTAQRSAWTVWSWVRRLQVSAYCRTEDRAVFVWWPDVSDRAFRHTNDAQSQRSA
jgi:hypothetical protein